MSSNELQVTNANPPAATVREDDPLMGLPGTLLAIRSERHHLGLPPYAPDEELNAARQALVACRTSVEKALANESLTVAAELDQACGYRPGMSSSSWAAPATVIGILVAVALAVGYSSFWPVLAACAILAAGTTRAIKADTTWRLNCAAFGVRPHATGESLSEGRRRTISAMTSEARRLLHGLPASASAEQVAAVHRIWYGSALAKDAGVEEHEWTIEEMKRSFDAALKLQMLNLPRSRVEAAAFEINCQRAEGAVYAEYRQRLNEAHAAYTAVAKALARERDAELERLNSNLPALTPTAGRLSQSE